jgi:prepilin-type N-terminal cleavage/methylation domain-containing protein
VFTNRSGMGGRREAAPLLAGNRARLSVRGFSLIELVITVTVLAILTLGVIPLVQVSVKRQKEERLRASLREMREAIDQFHREALAGAQMQANQQGQMSRSKPLAPSRVRHSRTYLAIRACVSLSQTRQFSVSIILIVIRQLSKL